jgi:resuscitation-promoting factor RpfA
MRSHLSATLVAAGALALGVTAVTAGTAQAATGSTWDRLAQCESGGNWSINTGNGFSGGLQFSPSTWRAYGGTAYAPSAYQAGRSAQIAVAQRVLAAQGWGAWPACSAKLGLHGTVASGGSSAPVQRVAPRVSRSETRQPLVTRSTKAVTTHRAPVVRSAPAVVHPARTVVRSAPVVAPARGATYVVRPGDYLSKIATQQGVSGGWQSVYALNRAQIGSDANLIFPGQRLRLH